MVTVLFGNCAMQMQVVNIIIH